MLTDGRWLTVSIYQTSFPCQGRVPSLCMSPCLLSEAFIPPVYTEGWKNQIIHTFRNHNTHYRALNTLHRIYKCTGTQTSRTGQRYDLTNNRWEMTHIWQICCEKPTCHKLTSQSTVDFSTAVTLKLLLLTHTLRNGRSFACGMWREERLTCFCLHCLLSCGEL